MMVLKYSVFIASMAIVFSGCKKDDDNMPSPSNPFNGKTTAVFSSSVTYGEVTDQDGNIYKTVTIGTQTWMAENLRTTKYNDGTAIPMVTDNSAWKNLSSGAFCNFNNTNNPDTIATFGRLYNWHSVNTGKLAPEGWHVPTDAEWTTLSTFLGGESIAGEKLSESGSTHWSSPNATRTNETGFTALPGGYRSEDGSFGGFGDFGSWWSATNKNGTHAWDRLIDMGNTFDRLLNIQQIGFSVRCIKD